MSLINDALRKAKQAQQQAPAPASPAPQLRPIEPSQHGRHGLGLMLSVGLVGVALLLLFFLWQFSQGNSAKTAIVAKAAMADQVPAVVQPVSGSPASSPTPKPEPLSTKPSVVAAEPAPVTSNAPVEVTASATTNAPPNGSTNQSVAVVSAPPKPAPLRLQGIFLSSTQPSALVSGKTLFIGDRIREFRLVALDQQTATLVSSDKTNILVLGEQPN